jgi:hypothetical protein
MVTREYDIMFDVRPQAANSSMQLQMFLNFLQVAQQWPELHRGEALMEYARLSGIPNPRKFLNVSTSDADSENAIFRSRGRFPPANPDDNHKHHLETHDELFPDDVRQHGQAGLAQFDIHMKDHLRYDGMSMQGGAAPPGPEMMGPQGGPQGGMPPEGMQGQGGGGGMPPMPEPSPGGMQGGPTY